MRVLLTGATGFLGSRVLPLLDGHDVLCLSRDAGRVPRRAGVAAVTADLGADGPWRAAVASFRPQWCVHLAWEGLPDYSLGRCRANLDASLRLLEAAADTGVQKVVVAGSCWEYGAVQGCVSEHMPPGELGVFAATKHALRGLLDSVARHAGFHYAWAIPFFTYGPGQRPTSLIPHLQASYLEGRPPAVREPDAVQDFIHVDDVAAALVALAASPAAHGVFNVGTGTPTSVGYVANRAAEYYGARPPFAALPQGRGFWADTSRIRAATGWRARIDIDSGLAGTLAASNVTA